MKGDLEQFRKDMLGYFSYLSAGEKKQLIDYINEYGSRMDELDEDRSFRLNHALTYTIEARWGNPQGLTEDQIRLDNVIGLRADLNKKPNLLKLALGALFFGRRGDKEGD